MLGAAHAVPGRLRHIHLDGRPTLLPHYQHALVLVPVHALRHVPGLSAAAPGELESGCAVVVRGWVERERAREGIDLAEAATRLRCIGC